MNYRCMCWLSIRKRWFPYLIFDSCGGFNTRPLRRNKGY